MEKTLPRLIQTGESASSYLTRTQLPLRVARSSEARSEPSLRKAGSTRHIEMAGPRSKNDSLRTFFETEGSGQAALTEKGAVRWTSAGLAFKASLDSSWTCEKGAGSTRLH